MHFLPQAQRLLTDLQTALVEILETGKAQRGDVSIACVPTAGVHYLPRIIQEYSARYPDNRIKILDHASSGVADAVLRREAEFGINIAESASSRAEQHHVCCVISSPWFAATIIRSRERRGSAGSSWNRIL